MNKRRIIKKIGLSLGILVYMILPLNSAAKQVRIKIATLAPEGSPWIKTFNALNAELRKKTDNQVRLKIYPGGVLGGEKDMLRKMYIGQIHGAVLTSATLSALFKEIDVFQIPFLFQTPAEVDYVLSKMTDFFRKGFEKKGYRLLAWSEGGFVRLMSTSPVDTLAKLKKLKVWTWEDAPMAKAIFDQAGVSAIPLSVPDVLVGLQTGLVDVVYAPPTGAIALQWFTKTKYLTDVPLIYLMGGIVIKISHLKKITAAHRNVLQNSFRAHANRLKHVIRKQNQEALRVMADHGVKILHPSNAEIEKFKKLSQKALQNMHTTTFSAEVKDEIEAHLETYRRTQKQ